MRHLGMLGLMLLGLVAVTAPSRADEGMWTFDNLPLKEMQGTYHFNPSEDWLSRVQRAALRVGGDCSGAFVSADGLLITNQHCIDECLAQLATPKRDYTVDGFYAHAAEEETHCPEMEVNQLDATRDVTSDVDAAVKGLDGERYANALRIVTGKLEDDCADGDHKQWNCEVVSLYHGGRYALYKYRRYQDVRLVFTPESAIATFGGDPDNFNFPRYSLDVALLRVYEHGKPAATPFLPFAMRDPADGELVFTAGNPGTTERHWTLAELKSLRDDDLVPSLIYYSELRGMLEQFAHEGPEQQRMAFANLGGIENAIKQDQGQLEALQDQTELDKKSADETALRDWVMADPARREKYGDPWSAIAAAEAKYHAIITRYRMLELGWGFESRLFDYARMLVRGEVEREKANGKRLTEFRDANLPQMVQTLYSYTPSSPDYEELMLGWSLTKLRAALGADDPLVRRVLREHSPEQVARAMVEGSRLDSAAYRRRLWDDKEYMRVASDPMLDLVRAVDEDARAVRSQYEEEVQAVLRRQGQLIAQARFERDGTGAYPDATFTLRLSYGQVRGWDEQDKPVASFTDLGGLYDRATGTVPFRLPQRWLEARPRLDEKAALNYVTTNDIVGGNSGSPVIDRDGHMVGLVFDGNIHSLGGDFWYDGSRNRAVVLDNSALLAALRTVYGMNALANELVNGHQ